MVAAVSFPTLPESPKPPESMTLSLYVWNATDQAAPISVAVDGTAYFDQTVAAGEGTSRHDLIELLPGPHAVAVTAGSAQRTVTVTADPQGNRWLVVTWWGRELEVGLQHQPPWVKPRESRLRERRAGGYSPRDSAASRTA